MITLITIAGIAACQTASTDEPKTLLRANRVSHEAITPPLINETQAIQFALAQTTVRSELTKLDEWWVKAVPYDPVNVKNRWLVVFGKGEEECTSPRQCFIQINHDGSIAKPFRCSDGWNCK